MSAMATVHGSTRMYAILGDPIAQVKSPETFTARFAAAGFDALLVPLHVPDAKLDDVVPALMALANVDGLLVTVPFKPRMVRYVQRLGDAANAVQAINAMRREPDGTWTGDMFDGAGFVRGAQAKGIRLGGRRVTLFGAGGAGSAIAYALGVAGVASIDIVDPLPGRADALRERLQPALPDCRVGVSQRGASDADMIVNASPVGMRGNERMPGEVGALSRDSVVGDVVITQTPTPLIRHAMDAGCAWVDGRAMLAGQVDAIMAFFDPVLRAHAPPLASGTSA